MPENVKLQNVPTTHATLVLVCTFLLLPLCPRLGARPSKPLTSLVCSSPPQRYVYVMCG